MKYPHDVQEEALTRLLLTARPTEFGRKYGFDEMVNYDDFTRQVPVHSYERLFPYIERMMKGEQNILWPSEIKWFSKSSAPLMPEVNSFLFQPNRLKNVILKEVKICIAFM